MLSLRMRVRTVYARHCMTVGEPKAAYELPRIHRAPVMDITPG